MTATSSGSERTTLASPGILVGLIMAIASAIIPNLDTGPSAVAEQPAAPTITEPAVDEPAPPGGMTPLDLLAIASEGAREGYSRGLFKHWIDADGNGCDTREEVLIEEALVPVAQGASCSLTGGQWLSIYDARTFLAPGGMDIDHMIPLGEAWDSGASEWDSVRRQDYANDLDHPEALIAVSASSNRSKGDRDPAEWIPSNMDHHCQYAIGWVTVKVAWELSADPAEVEALQELLSTCEVG